MNLQPRELSDAEYEALKKKLHHAHDTIIKVTLHEVEAMRELLEKIVMPLLKGIKLDLDGLKLDTTTYIRKNLQVFYSDVVYMTTLIDETKGSKELVKVSLLIEHKSDMPAELPMRFQLVDYINAIMKKHYNKETNTTIAVIPIVINQFDKEWEPQSFRSLFPQLSDAITRFILEFEYLIINLPTLPDEIMDKLDKFGTLKAALLAMRYVRNKLFLKQHFEEIFLFLQKHPDKIDLRDQLIAYVLGQSDLTVQDLEELLNNIFSPVLKQEIMISGTGFLAVAAREAAAKATSEAQFEIEKARNETIQMKTLNVMYGWHGGISMEKMTKTVDLKPTKINQLITAFEKVKTYCLTKPEIDMKELIQLSGLSEVDLKALLVLLK